MEEFKTKIDQLTSAAQQSLDALKHMEKTVGDMTLNVAQTNKYLSCAFSLQAMSRAKGDEIVVQNSLGRERRIPIDMLDILN